MSDTPSPTPPIDYSSLGLVANPFAPRAQSESDPFWVKLLVHAAANRLHVAVARMGESYPTKPILVDLPTDVPDYYYVSAENAFLRRTGEDARMNTLAANIGLDMMRLGKIRGTLTEMSELVAAVEFDSVMSLYAAGSLRDPDTTLEEYARLEGLDLAPIADEFERDPKASAERFFGSSEYLRDDAAGDLVLREAYYRGTSLDPDPDEPAEAVEDVPGETDAEPLALEPVEQPAEDTAGTPSEEEIAAARDAAVARYVIAHARAHLSPVIARAMRSYVANGFGAAAQELKVTKAPKKTLAAVVRFERLRFDRVVLMYDGFDPWDLLDEDARVTAVAGLVELRHVIAKDGVMVVLLPKDRYPEIEEVFGGASRVDWEMRGVFALQGGEMGLDRDLAQYWIDSASLQAPASLRVDDALLEPVIEASHDDILIFAGMMARAIDDAAMRGVTRLDEQAITAALGQTKG